MKKESELVIPVLSVLNESSSGALSTREVRELVKSRIALTVDDLKPLKSRSDTRIDQVIRNLKCHRNVPGNPFSEGLIESRPRGMAITKKGKRYLSN